MKEESGWNPVFNGAGGGVIEIHEVTSQFRLSLESDPSNKIEVSSLEELELEMRRRDFSEEDIKAGVLQARIEYERSVQKRMSEP